MTRRTVARGSLTMRQDITKPQVWRWDASEGIDGDPYDWRSEGLLVRRNADGDNVTHATIDSIPVMRVNADIAGNSWKRTILFKLFPQFSASRNWRWSGKAHFDGTWWLGTEMFPSGNQGYLFEIINCRAGSYGLEIQGWGGYPLPTSWSLRWKTWGNSRAPKN